MIPISIIVKILEEFNMIEIVGDFLSPSMEIVGLPGEFGLVWATAMITNIYGGLIVFFTLSIENSYTVAQVTILSSMILVAHTLPIELRIAQRAGVRLWFMFFLRFFGAFILGWILYVIYSFFNVNQNAVTILWNPGKTDSSLVSWFLQECKNYLIIFLIILGLLLLMKILKISGLIKKLNKILKPGLEFLGMSKEAAPITIIGMTLGLAYGGGLIINEAKSDLLTKKDSFLSLSMMGLSHSLIEDTLLMLSIGAALSGILLGRFVFTILVIFILIKCINHLSKRVFDKYFIC
jgi:spore maturation protein SpmB